MRNFAMTRKLTFALILILFAAAPLFAASDVLTIGTLSAQRGTVAAVPVYIRDVSGTPLGMDQAAANRIQGIGFKVSYSPASAVSAATFTRAGVLQGLTALYETVLTPAGAVGYVASFAQSTNPVPLVINAAAPGNLIGYLNLTIPQSVAGGTTITLTVDSINAALSNQTGAVIETGNNGKLAITNGSVSVTLGSTSSSVRADFNGNGKSDLWWRNTTTGDNYIWYTSATAFAGGDTPPPVGTAAVFTGTGDFNADGRADVLWRNTSTGGVSVWFMNGGGISGGLTLPSISAPNLIVAGIGDFNGDGYADILWRNTATGDNSIWYITAPGFTGGANAPTVNNSNFVVAAVADFNADGHADIFWRNTATGDDYIWLMNGGGIIGGSQLPTIPPSFTVAAGDFNGDGQADLIWRNPSTGANSIWYINQGGFYGQGVALPSIPGNLVIAAVGDFNGDGTYDLMWRNTSTGDNSIWFITANNGFNGGMGLPNVSGSAVQVVAPK
jgi:hypothetical protein